MNDREIVMYVRPYCSDVAIARAALSRAGAKWREVDIEQDADAAAMVRDWTGREATPTLWIGDKMLVEPSAQEVEEALS